MIYYDANEERTYAVLQALYCLCGIIRRPFVYGLAISDSRHEVSFLWALRGLKMARLVGKVRMLQFRGILLAGLRETYLQLRRSLNSALDKISITCLVHFPVVRVSILEVVEKM